MCRQRALLPETAFTHQPWTLDKLGRPPPENENGMRTNTTCVVLRLVHESNMECAIFCSLLVQSGPLSGGLSKAQPLVPRLISGYGPIASW